MTTLTARGLRKSYEGEGASTVALAEVDIDIAGGDFVAVMGPSGSGKSTLLHMLGGLDTPDEGEVRLGDKILTSLSRRELALVRRRDVGFVFQFFNLVPVLTVEENVFLPAVLDDARGPESRSRVEQLLSSFGLTEHRAKLPAQLSGGEQQRVAIARALVNEPAIVLADEPTGNLDRTSGNGVMSLLRRLNTDGQTVVCVTHDPGVASFAKRVVFMRDGRLVDEVAPEGPGEPGAILERLADLER